jgi:hypothetical protein
MRSPGVTPGRAAGSEPVATMAWPNRMVCGASPSTRSDRDPSKTPRPLTTSTFLARATPARPLASFPTTRSAFHFRSGSSATCGGPNSTPSSRARSASAMT